MCVHSFLPLCSPHSHTSWWGEIWVSENVRGLPRVAQHSLTPKCSPHALPTRITHSHQARASPAAPELGKGWWPWMDPASVGKGTWGWSTVPSVRGLGLLPSRNVLASAPISPCSLAQHTLLLKPPGVSVGDLCLKRSPDICKEIPEIRGQEGIFDISEDRTEQLTLTLLLETY